MTTAPFVAEDQTPANPAPTSQVREVGNAEGGTGHRGTDTRPSESLSAADALAAARTYLRGIEGFRESNYRTSAEKRVLQESIRETAQIMQELGLVGRYLPTVSRWTRKRQAYAEVGR